MLPVSCPASLYPRFGKLNGKNNLFEYNKAKA